MSDKSFRGNASQFFVAGELCRRGYAAVVTMGNTPNTDILCSNQDGTRFVHVQVKTFVPRTKTCSVDAKSERDFGPRFFWILAGIPLPESAPEFEYYIIPSAAMAKNVSAFHRRWLAAPGKSKETRGQFGQGRQRSAKQLSTLVEHRRVSRSMGSHRQGTGRLKRTNRGINALAVASARQPRR